MLLLMISWCSLSFSSHVGGVVNWMCDADEDLGRRRGVGGLDRDLDLAGAGMISVATLLKGMLKGKR